jgi:hypothetical protein
LARADNASQRNAVGGQFAGRVGLFLRVDDFDAAYERITSAGVEFLTSPRTEPYGRVAVFADIACTGGTSWANREAWHTACALRERPKGPQRWSASARA